MLETPAKRGRGRPRKSEEEKAAIAETRKLRKARGDEGVGVRHEMPTSELQLIIRASVKAAAEKPEARSKRPAQFWEEPGREWGVAVKMPIKIMSEEQGRTAQAFVDARRKMTPDQRGRQRFWRRHTGRGKRKTSLED